MFLRLGKAVTRYWWLTILMWFGVVIGLRLVAPNWDDITHDGDLAFLPREMPSSIGERLQLEAFPENRSQSQIVLIFSRDDQPLTQADLKTSDRFAGRFHNLLAIRLATDDDNLAASLEQLDEAIRLDPENAEAIHNRAIVRLRLKQPNDAKADREVAWTLNPELQSMPNRFAPLKTQLPLVDVWTRHNRVVGSKLRSVDKQAQLIILQLDSEFMATENIDSLDFVKQELASVRGEIRDDGLSGLRVHLSGSAAIGGDMLDAAAESIENTELYTVVLVIVILLIVYRAPLIVIVPLVTIGVSLSVSINLLSMLAELAGTPGFEWWRFKVFTTTKIFIVVILFGAGTDFCLFLIARFRECLEEGDSRATAIPRALFGVGDALTASALTTIVGLSMMFFADFGKFRSSGPAIGLCLLVTLFACLTLAPALLRALGAAVFWPFHPQPTNGSRRQPRRGRLATLWQRLASILVLHPGKILVGCVLLLAPLAYFGSFSPDHTTFDLLNSLARSRESYLGSDVLKQHFPIGEGSPIIVLADKHNAGFDSEDRRTVAVAMGAIFDLTAALTEVEGVTAVRSLAEPLGDKPRWSIRDTEKLTLRQHRLTKSIFLAQSPEHRGNVTRFELILNHDPFSSDAIETLLRVEAFLRTQRAQPDSFWKDAKFAFAGTTAGIRDLRDVTRSDRTRIQVLVVLAVYLVLVVILRQPVVCLYLIASVLFSYFITIGATELFFMWQYGDTFQGLDWKVPIFLFVILVAVGEDYNIYLVTRINEEQQLRGPFAGLREGVIRTGGIITSCGVIMAGTFVSMTTGTLRGIVELGFSLSLGVLFDTFVVRTILVPAFLALLLRASLRRDRRDEASTP
ncbi:MAG: MMPL family transporter [Planctomycetota bacterium]|nr:MMPL family transporter [Planctomycetota bacterium]